MQIFDITKCIELRMFPMLELMHLKQTKSSIAWKTEMHNSYIPNISTKKKPRKFWEVGVGNWQFMQECFFEFTGEQMPSEG